MYWTKLGILTLREDTHPWLMRAGYKHGAEYLALGQRSLAKIQRLLLEENGLRRCGVLYVQAGNHFVAETEAGHYVVVQGRDYAALLDEAVGVPAPPARLDPEGPSSPEEFATPGVKTIAQISAFSGLPGTSQMKSLVMHADAELIMVLLRGDHQLSEYKFQALTQASHIRQATAAELHETFGADAGSLGPVGVQNVRIIADHALKGRRNLICGANRNDFHLRNITPGRDFACEYADVRKVAQGDECINGGPLRFVNARLLESAADILEIAAEQNHDADGLMLPRAIAPFDVIVTPVHPSHLDLAQKLYDDLTRANLEVLLDDRDARPGVKFKDADLLGIPFRVNLGKKLAEGLVEMVERNPRRVTELKWEEVTAWLAGA